MVQLVGEDQHGSGVGEELARRDDEVLLEAEGVGAVDWVQQDLQLDRAASGVQVLGDHVPAGRVAHQDEPLHVRDHPRDAVVEDQLQVLIHPVYHAPEGLAHFLGVRALQLGNLPNRSFTET